jgi:hypothetical protein
MECVKAHSLFSAYVDDELGPKEREELFRHTQICQTCGQELEESLVVHRLFRSAERFNAPPFFSAGVMAHIGEDKRSWFEILFLRQSLFFKFVEVGFALLIMTVGIFSGNMLVSDRLSGQHSAPTQEVLPLDAFGAMPDGSVGNIYVALTRLDNER